MVNYMVLLLIILNVYFDIEIFRLADNPRVLLLWFVLSRSNTIHLLIPIF